MCMKEWMDKYNQGAKNGILYVKTSYCQSKREKKTVLYECLEVCMQHIS